jgi:hypothetical protein
LPSKYFGRAIAAEISFGVQSVVGKFGSTVENWPAKSTVIATLTVKVSLDETTS